MESAGVLAWFAVRRLVWLAQTSQGRASVYQEGTMTNIIEIIKPVIDAAADDWRVQVGMVAAGVLIGVGKWVWNKRKGRNDQKRKDNL